MRTGAELAALRQAAAGMQEIGADLTAVVGPFRRALEQIGAASGQPQARRACDAVDRDVQPALRRLRVTAASLSASATGQASAFRTADGQ